MAMILQTPKKFSNKCAMFQLKNAEHISHVWPRSIFRMAEVIAKKRSSEALFYSHQLATRALAMTPFFSPKVTQFRVLK
jgi:hypothetical protein